MTYVVSRLCEHDLERLFREGVALFGRKQAERYQDDLRVLFDLLSDNPGVARLHSTLRRPVCIHPFRAHLVVYVEHGATILILARSARSAKLATHCSIAEAAFSSHGMGSIEVRRPKKLLARAFARKPMGAAIGDNTRQPR